MTVFDGMNKSSNSMSKQEEDSEEYCSNVSIDSGPFIPHNTTRLHVFVWPTVPVNANNIQTSWFQFVISIKNSFAVSQFRVCILWRPHLKANYITTSCEGCPNLKAPPNAGNSFPCFRRMHRYHPSWPHISQDSLCTQKKRRENGDITWRWSSLLWDWVAEMVT